MDSFVDALGYDAIGWNLAQGNGFSRDPPIPTPERAPVYPFFLAAVYFFFGHNYTAARLAQVVIGALTCLVIYFIGKEIYNERIGLLAALAAAVYPQFIVYSGCLLSERVDIFLLSLAMLFGVKAAKRSSIRLYFASGALLGAATLCRPVTMFFPFFLFLALVILYKNKRTAIMYSLAFLLATVLVIAPWTIRNYFAFDTFLPVSIYGGRNLLQGTYREDDQWYLQQAVAEHYASIVKDIDDPIEADGLCFKEAVKRIMEDPIGYLRLVARRMTKMWIRPVGLGVMETKTTGFIRLSAQILLYSEQFLILTLALLGLIHSRSNRLIIPLVLILVYFMFAHSITHFEPRYLLPVMPYVLILAAAGFNAALSLYRGHSKA